MKLTKQVRDCARLAIRDGYAHLWVTIAGNATWECGDVYELAELSDPSCAHAACQVAKRPSKEPMAAGIIRYADMIKTYAKEAEAIAEQASRAAEQAYLAEKRAQKAARESAILSGLLAAFRARGVKPTENDLVRAGITGADWDKLTSPA